MLDSFQGITALITGASSGIGKSFARELAKQGAHLILTARNVQKLDQQATDLKQRYGITVHTFAGDLSKAETCQRLFEFTEKQRLTVDLLVNNAGLAQYGFFEESAAQDKQIMLNLNIQALVLLTHLFLPGMLKREKGGVINIASTAGFQAIPYLSLYASTKAFVIHFSEGLWAECQGRGVRVFCVCPGNTLTRFHQTAGIEKNKIFFSASSRDVARFALKKFLRSRCPVGIYGLWNKLMIYAERLSPRQLTVFFARLLFRPPGIKAF